MKAECQNATLKDAVQIVEKIATRNQSAPIASGIRITARKKALSFVATNLETGIEMSINASITGDGDIVVPGSIFANFVGNLPNNGHVTIESTNNSIEITMPGSSTTLRGQSSADFPGFPQLEKAKTITVPIRELIGGLRSVAYASSYSDIKPEIAAVLVKQRDNGIVCVATDSFRLAEKWIKISNQISFDGLLIPHRSVAEIVRVFDGKEGVLEVTYTENQILFSFDTIRLITRLVDGTFPAYEQIIPKKFSTDVVVPKQIFATALKTASIFSNKLSEIHLIVGGADNNLTIQTSTGDDGAHTTHIKANVTGNDVRMTLNHKYISECLQYVHSNDIILRFPGERGPLVITGLDDSSFQYLIMPMAS